MMRLFHVSEEKNIDVFVPRKPERKDLDPNVPLVWAIDEQHLCNFLTPRNCPRIGIHDWDGAKDADREKWFPKTERKAVYVERQWQERMEKAVLYLYEFDTDGFALQDENAGYYVSTNTETPIACHVVKDLPAAIKQCGAELRLVDNLWPVADEVRASMLQWSLCRMGYAAKREEEI